MPKNLGRLDTAVHLFERREPRGLGFLEQQIVFGLQAWREFVLGPEQDFIWVMFRVPCLLSHVPILDVLGAFHARLFDWLASHHGLGRRLNDRFLARWRKFGDQLACASGDSFPARHNSRSGPSESCARQREYDGSLNRLIKFAAAL